MLGKKKPNRKYLVAVVLRTLHGPNIPYPKLNSIIQSDNSSARPKAISDDRLHMRSSKVLMCGLLGQWSFGEQLKKVARDPELTSGERA